MTREIGRNPGALFINPLDYLLEGDVLAFWSIRLGVNLLFILDV